MNPSTEIRRDIIDKQRELYGLLSLFEAQKAENAEVTRIRRETLRETWDAVLTCRREIEELQSGKQTLPMEAAP